MDSQTHRLLDFDQATGLQSEVNLTEILKDNHGEIAQLVAIETYVHQYQRYSFDELMPHMLLFKNPNGEEEAKTVVRIARITMQKAPIKCSRVFEVINREFLEKCDTFKSSSLYDEILEFGKAAVVAYDTEVNSLGMLDLFMPMLERLTERGVDNLYEILVKLLDRDVISIQYYIDILPQLIQTAETSSYDKLVLNLLRYFYDLLSYHPGLIPTAGQYNLPHTCILLAGHPKYEIKSSALSLCALLVQDSSCSPYILENAQNLCLHLIHNSNKEICESAVRLLSSIGHTSAVIREQLILRNLAPSLLTILTNREHKNVKRVLLELLRDILADKNQYLVDEIVENNLLLVICRICERDNHNRKTALDCIKEIVEMNNEIYNAILRECGIMKFLRVVGEDNRCKELAEDIKRRIEGDTKIQQQGDRDITNRQDQTTSSHSGNTTIVTRDKNEEVKKNRNAKVSVKRKRSDSRDVPMPVKKSTAARSNLPPKPSKTSKPIGKRNTTKAKLTQSIKSGLILPVALIARRMRKATGLRMSKSAPVYLTAILEYLTSELLSLAGDSVHTLQRRKRIQPRDLLQSLLSDSELSKMCPKLVIAESGHISLI